MKEATREKFWRTVKRGNVDVSKMTMRDAINHVLTAFDALLSIIIERDARIAELIKAGRAMAADYEAFTADGDFRHDPQLLAEWDACLGADYD